MQYVVIYCALGPYLLHLLCLDSLACLRACLLRSVPWYDAKLWQFVKQHGQAGDFIWNVAAVPDDVEAAAAEAICRIDREGPP